MPQCDQTARPPFLRRLMVGVLLINMFVMSLVALSLHASSHQYEDRAAVETENLAQVLEQHVDGILDKTAVTLFAAAEEVEHQSARGTSRPQLQQFLDRMASQMPELDCLAVTDPRGTIIYHTGTDTGPLQQASDHPYFRHLSQSPEAAPYISHPFKSRISGKWVIIIAQRITLGDDSFGGVVAATLSLGYFNQIFASINVGPHGMIVLRDPDLGVITRYPERDGIGGSIGQKRISPEMGQLVAEGKTRGTFTTTASVDGIERTYSFRKLEGYRLYIAVGRAGKDYLEEWRAEAYQLAGAALLFFALTLFASRYIYKGWVLRDGMLRTLAEQQVKYRTVAHYTHDWEYWIGPEGEFRYTSPSCLRVTGHDAAEFYADPGLLEKLIHEDDRATYAAHRCEASQGTDNLTFRIIRADGTIRWLEHACRPIVDDAGDFLGNRCSNRDITARKETEAKLADQMKYSRQTIEAVDEGIIVIDTTRKLRVWNPYMQRLSGLSEEEVLYRHPVELFPFLRETGMEERIEMALSGETPAPADVPYHFPASGRSGWFLERNTPLRNNKGEIVSVLVTVLDITERKKGEQALQETQYVVDHAPFPIFWMRDGGQFYYINAACDYLGYSREELLGMTPFDIDPDLTPEEVTRMFHIIKEHGHGTFERRHRTRTGDDIPMEVTTHTVHLTSKSLHVSYVTDISERKENEAKIARSEHKFRAIFENARDAIFLIGADSFYVDCNPAATEMFGCSKEELLHKNPQFFSPRTQPDGRDTEQKAFDLISAALEGEPQSMEWKHRRQDGTEFEAMVVLSRFELDNKPMLLAIVRDISKKKSLERQLYHVQKMESVGTLAGGIAHDFNNLLTVLIGYGNILKARMMCDDPLIPMVDQIINATNRAAELTRGLLTFSRTQAIDSRPVNLNDVVNGVEKLLRRLIGEDVDFITKLAPSPLRICADAGQIEQVLMNLATNARDAMPEGGAITITTEEVCHTNSTPQGLIKPGSYALLTVTDTGTGMDEHTQAKIFEPFYTTKEAGSGTGLGLAIVYGIVKQHNGFINVHSEPGKGASFQIHLPLVAAMLPDATTNSAAPPRGGSETLLLIEDDRVVRDMAKIFLKDSGYRVIDASDGEEALEKFRTHESEIDLLILDVILPKKSGAEIYKTVRSARPDMDILFVSGHSVDIIKRRGIPDEDIDFVSKPVAPSDLLRRIREILDRKGSREGD